MEASGILNALSVVEGEREKRLLDTALGISVVAVKAYQHRRFARTYADMLSSPRYSAAARFFLDDLYGPSDFSERDAQFATVVPALVRLFSREIVETVDRLAKLHAISERFDSLMGGALLGQAVHKVSYSQAWRAVADEAGREQQIALLLSVGAALDRLTRKAVLRHSLHLMRGPARAAGLGQLQQFLERGFDTFKTMKGAESFLSLVSTRERELAQALFRTSVADRSESGGELQELRRHRHWIFCLSRKQ